MAQLGDIGVEPGAIRAKGATAAYRRRKSSARKCLASADDALAGFDRGHHIFGLTKGQFSMIDLAISTLRKTGPADVGVWTWCIAEYEVEAISGFLTAGEVTSLRMVMDWTGAQRDMPIIEDLQRKFGEDCIRVTKTHAKIVTVSTVSGWRVVIRGSMNLNNNPRFEQFDVSDDAATFDVISAVMDELWVIGKPMPVRKLKHNDATAMLNTAEVGPAGPSWAPKHGNWFNAR